MSNTNDSNPDVPSTPINIIRGRGRRASIATLPALSTSPTSPLPASIQTPASSFSLRFNNTSNSNSRTSSGGSADDNTRVVGGPGGSPTSPLAYFLGTASPIKSTVAGGNFFGSGKTVNNVEAIDEDDDGPPGAGSIGLFGMGAHTRRASWAQNPLAGGGNMAAPTSTANDRGTGVLRRLSLSIQRPTFNAPAPPPNSAASSNTLPRAGGGLPNTNTVYQPKGEPLKRSATLAVSDPVKKRSISPMGERLLKGHFDGF